MRTTNIFLSLCIVMSVAGLQSYAQQTESPQNEKLRAQVDSVLKAIDEKNYTRIPNVDFDEKLNSKISSLLESKLAFWLAIFGAFFAMTGGLIIVALNKLLNDAVSKKVDSSIKRLETEMSAKLTRETQSAKKSIGADLVDLRNDLKQEKNFNEYAKRLIFEDQLEKVKEKVDRKQYTESTIISLENLLQEANRIESNQQLIKAIIDELVYLCYIYKQEQKVMELLAKYEDKGVFDYRAYVNSALVFSERYSSYNSQDDRAKALELFDKSLFKLQGYGEALAGKMEIYLIDYEKSSSEKAKDEALRSLRTVIDDINSGRTSIAAVEVLARLRRTKSVEPFARYYKLLYDLFGPEMKRMEEREQTYSDMLNISRSGNPLTDILKNIDTSKPG